MLYIVYLLIIKSAYIANDKNKPDEYPKPDENDKRWKQQDEFDSSGFQRQLEDEEKNASVARSPVSPDSDGEKNKEA